VNNLDLRYARLLILSQPLINLISKSGVFPAYAVALPGIFADPDAGSRPAKDFDLVKLNSLPLLQACFVRRKVRGKENSTDKPVVKKVQN
jgi:hypothetical protein